MDSYRKHKHMHSLLVKNTKKSYYQARVNKSHNRVKIAQKGIDELTNKNSNVGNFINSRMGEQPIESPEMIASEFNDFFIETPKNIQAQITKTKCEDNI